MYYGISYKDALTIYKRQENIFKLTFYSLNSEVLLAGDFYDNDPLIYIYNEIEQVTEAPFKLICNNKYIENN